MYTNILSPLFYYKQLVNRRQTYWQPFFLFLLTMDVIHLYLGVDLKSFVVSNLLFISCYFTVISFYHFFNGYAFLSKLYKQLLVINFAFVLVSIPFLFTPIDTMDIFWWVNKLTKGVTDFPRLKLLTYEASYYSTLLVPVCYYYLFKFLFRQIHNSKIFTAILVLAPLLMSMSFGVIGATLLTAFVMAFVFRKKLLRYRRAFIVSSVLVVLLLLGAMVLLVFFPHNPITIRAINIVDGTDTSANGRISDSFTMAWRIADIKSIWFGIGLGQIKIQIVEMVRIYYNYWGNFERYDIPNTMAETLAIFGVVGVALRLFLEFYLFYKTKVASNYYRLALFIFIFIYQFTGSFITNIAEYTIWCLAFARVFDQFNVKPENQ